MDLIEFQTQVISELHDRFPDYELETMDVTKLQGQSYPALSVKPSGSDIAVSLNMAPYYDRAESGADMEVILSEIAKATAEAIDQTPALNLSELKDYDQMKQRFSLQLIPVSGNEEKLSQIPHRNIEDMAIVYRFDFPLDAQNTGSILLDNILMAKYGIDEKKLADDAVKAAVRNHPPTLRNMTEVMKDMMGESSGIIPNEDSPLWVASVEGGQNGACVIQYPGFLEEAAKKLDGNFYILPSSIHEVLLVKNDGFMKLSDLEDMVRCVNQTEVASKDKLSDNVYHYDSKEKVFEKARSFEDRQLNPGCKNSQKRIEEKKKIVHNIQ